MSDIFKKVKKNKTKFFIAGGLISTIYGAYRLSRYIQNYRPNREPNNTTLNFKILKAQYFQSMITNGYQITVTLLKNLKMELKSSIDPDNIALSLGIDVPCKADEHFNEESGIALTSEIKLELWQKLKVLCLTKVTILVLCWSYLTVTIHIQMSILAGHLFSSDNGSKSVDLMSTIQNWLFSSKSNNHLDENFQKEFINFTLTQLKQQIPRWISLVHAASLKVIGKMSLKRMIMSDDIRKYLNEINEIVKSDIFALCLQGIQLHNSNKRLEGPMYVTLMDTFQNSGLANIEVILALFKEKVCERLKTPPGCSDDETCSRMPLAKFIPFIWTIFDTDSIMTDCIKEFCSGNNFRFMIFKTFDGCINP